MRKVTVMLILTLAVLLATVICTGCNNDRNTSLLTDDVHYDEFATELILSGDTELDIDSLCACKNLRKLDLRNTKTTAEEYEQLCKALPNCTILWKVPFQRSYLEPETKMLTITSLTQKDLDSLKYFPSLESIQATQCENLDMLMSLRECYPDVNISYRVPIGEKEIESGTAFLQVEDPDAEELMKQLTYLPELEKVTLTGVHSGNDAVLELVKAYPNIDFTWNVQLLDMEFPNTSQEIDISGIPLEGVEIVEDALKYFPNLEKVVMSHCGLSNEVMDEFRNRQEKVKIVWSVAINTYWVRTDATFLIPYQCGGVVVSNDVVDSLKYLTDMVCIDFGHMYITDLSFLYYMPNLKYLILADCGVQDITPIGSLKKLEYLEIFLNSIRDISALAGCTELRDVNMCYNPIMDASALLELKNLENIWASGTDILWTQRQALKEAFPNARIAIYDELVSSTGNGWRQIPRYYEQRDYMGLGYAIEY